MMERLTMFIGRERRFRKKHRFNTENKLQQNSKATTTQIMSQKPMNCEAETETLPVVINPKVNNATRRIKKSIFKNNTGGLAKGSHQ